MRGALNAWLSLLAHDELAEDWHREAMRLHGLLGEREQALLRFERCRAVLAQELGLVPLPETVDLAERLRSGEAAPPPSQRPKALATLARLPLTGRGPLLERLGQRAAGLVVLLGEPGVGKTRLAEEVAARRGLSLTLRGSEVAAHTPLAPLVLPLRAAWLGGQLGELPAPARSELGRLIPELGSAPAPDTSPAGRARFLQALVQAVVCGLTPHGTLILDDLQWFDDTTLEVVTLLFQVLGAERLCLATARPAELDGAPAAALHTWARTVQVINEPLTPLAEADLLTLVRQLAGADEGQRFTRRLHAVTAGNPLFVLETLRGLLESGEIEVGADGWLTAYDDVTLDYQELPMQPSVRAAVLARVDRLGPEARRVLDAACLAGDVFTLRELAGATALDEWTGLSALERAETAGLLVAEGSGHRFSHALVRRALRGALGPSREGLLHRRLAESLIALGGDPVVIAQHLEADPLAAAPWWHQAAQLARRRYAAAAATSYLGRALSALGTGDARRLPWLLERIKLAHALGLHSQETADLDEVQTLAFSDLDRGMAALARARYLSVCGQPAQAREIAETAAAHLRRAGSAQGQYEAEQCLAEMAYYQEAFAPALASSEAAVAQARLLGPEALATALNWLGIVRDATLDPEGALAAFAEGLTLGQQVGDGYLLARLHNNRATIYSLYGCHALALHDLDEALALIRRGGYRHLEGFVLDTRVRVLRGLERLDEAQADLAQALTIGHETASHRLVSHCLHHQVLLLNDQRAYPAVLDAAERAFEAAGATGSLTDRVFTLTGRSQALLALGQLQAALKDAAEAAALIEQTGGVREGLPFFVWHAHICALEASNHSAEAEQHRQRARGELHALAGRLRNPQMRSALLALPECAALWGDPDGT